MKAWYFSARDCRLRCGDNRKIEAGITHKVEPPLELCKHGLHASVRPIDAISYAPGPVVWRVDQGGEVIKGFDKVAATHRTYLWGYDATDVLRRFARLCALDVIHLWDAPDVVVRYLKTGDKQLRDAAWDAAWGAKLAAARVATRAAAARVAAPDAALGAAREAAWLLAPDAAWGAYNKRLYRMLMEGRP